MACGIVWLQEGGAGRSNSPPALTNERQTGSRPDDDESLMPSTPVCNLSDMFVDEPSREMTPGTLPPLDPSGTAASPALAWSFCAFIHIILSLSHFLSVYLFLSFSLSLIALRVSGSASLPPSLVQGFETPRPLDLCRC